MAVTANSTISPQAPKITPIQLTTGTGLASVTAFTAGANGSKVVAILANSTETVNARILQLQLTRSAVNYLIGSYSVPVNSGNDGVTAGADLLNGGPAGLIQGLPGDNDGQKYLLLESGDTVTVASTTTITTGKTLTVVCIASNF